MKEPAILLVGDVPENLVAVEAVLEPIGHRTVRARSGEEALRHLLTDDIGVIVLGLAVCRRLVERSGGHISMERNAPGHGVTVHFSLPAAP